MVKTGQIAIYYGAGKGKTSVSLGKGIRPANTKSFIALPWVVR